MLSHKREKVYLAKSLTTIFYNKMFYLLWCYIPAIYTLISTTFLTTNDFFHWFVNPTFPCNRNTRKFLIVIMICDHQEHSPGPTPTATKFACSAPHVLQTKAIPSGEKVLFIHKLLGTGILTCDCFLIIRFQLTCRQDVDEIQYP